MKRDVFRLAGDRCILREQFRNAQEVQDRGYVINGTGITFPGNGVRFTGAAGQRLVLPRTPSRTLGLRAFSAHVAFTPEFAKTDAAKRVLFDLDSLGYVWWWPEAALYCAAPGDSWKVAASNTSVNAVWRDYARNYLSYTITNGAQSIWLNGSLLATSNVSPMPAAKSFQALSATVGAYSLGGGHLAVFNGTIHEIAWFDTTMTLEEHLDWMQGDTYSEVWS